MKKSAAALFFMLLMPVLISGQYLEEQILFDENDDQHSDQHVSVSKADLIQPVLMRSMPDVPSGGSLQDLYTRQPGLALLSSAVLPGSGQLVNKNWIRGGLYAAIEIASIYVILDYNRRGRRGEERYENFADQNWSVAQYAKWIVEYHDVNGLQNDDLEPLRNMVEGIEPAFNTETDWNSIDINVLRNAEKGTQFVTPDNLSNSNFSHSLPGYGSQQYYELISKYYQYQAGWRDYYSYHQENNSSPFLISRDGDNASTMFFEGASLARNFNSNLRTSSSFTILLIANHVVSAFDSFFTFKLKQNRLEATTTMAADKYVQLRFHF